MPALKPVRGQQWLQHGLFGCLLFGLLLQSAGGGSAFLETAKQNLCFLSPASFPKLNSSFGKRRPLQMLTQFKSSAHMDKISSH